jgi:hypothetical protein
MCSRAPSLRGHYPTSGPAAAVSPSIAFPVSPVIRWTLLERFPDGTRTVSPVAQHVLVTVLPLLPRRSDTPRRSVCAMPCCLRPTVEGSAFGVNFVEATCGFTFVAVPVTRSPSQGWLCQLASSASFPPRMQPKLRGSDYYPRLDCLPLNMPAFAGRTTVRILDLVETTPPPTHLSLQ